MVAIVASSRLAAAASRISASTSSSRSVTASSARTSIRSAISSSDAMSASNAINASSAMSVTNASACASSAAVLRAAGARAQEPFPPASAVKVAHPRWTWGARGSHSRATVGLDTRQCARSTRCHAFVGSGRASSRRAGEEFEGELRDGRALARRSYTGDETGGFDEIDGEDWLDGDDDWLEDGRVSAPLDLLDKSSSSNADSSSGSAVPSNRQSWLTEDEGGSASGGEAAPEGPLGGKLGNAERKELRAYAHRMGNRISTHQIGKWGVTSTVITSLHDGLEKHELLKIKISDNCPDEAWEVGQILEEKLAAQVVGLIGRTALLGVEGGGMLDDRGEELGMMRLGIVGRGVEVVERGVGEAGKVEEGPREGEGSMELCS
ncbi:unnamed protein product [Closterium sp. Yama58-4]|nr:unnamed protein product [Closterium sp. Yama58-4]